MSEVMQYKTTAEQKPIYLTDAALQHVVTYLKKTPEACGIRFSVKKTGCSGLSYVIDYIDSIVASDVVIPLDETYQIYIEAKSYPFLKGMTVDYVRQGLNYKFVFNNPNQTGACGCGESFTIE